MTGLQRPNAAWMQFSEDVAITSMRIILNTWTIRPCEEVGGDQIKEDVVISNSDTACMQSYHISFEVSLPNGDL